MSGTGYPAAYAYAQSPHNDLSYPEYPGGRVTSIPHTARIPSLPLPVPHPLPLVPLSMQAPAPLPPPPPHRLPSIPQSMQLPSINRVPSIPSILPHPSQRPLTMQPTTSLSMVDPMVGPSWGYWPGAATYEAPAYGVSSGFMMPGYGYSVGPPMHLYQQSRGGSLGMDMGGGVSAVGQEGGGGAVMVDMGGGMMQMMHPMGMVPPMQSMAALPPQRGSTGPKATPATARAEGGKGGGALNVRVSPPPFDKNAAPTGSFHAYPQFSSDPAFRGSGGGGSSGAGKTGGAVTTLDAATFHANIRQLTGATARLLCLPCEDHEAGVLFVHSYQYVQILKRREQRKADTRKRIKSKHKSRQAHAARRVRGSGGRFLTKEEKAMLVGYNRP